jgi:hypothetical protein
MTSLWLDAAPAAGPVAAFAPGERVDVAVIGGGIAGRPAGATASPIGPACAVVTLPSGWATSTRWLDGSA